MRESVAERAERQYRERMAFYDHLAARTQAAKDLLARERDSTTNPLDKCGFIP